MAEMPLTVSVEECARLLGVGRSTAYTLVLGGVIESVKIGRCRRVLRHSITDYLASLVTEAS